MKVDLQIPDWLERLPLAPEFHPTDTEFADPIAYISKIEKEASVFGICKIIPPFPKPSKKYVLMNLNKSLLKCPELGSDVNATEICYSGRTDSGNAENNGELRAVFTTRHQELGQSVNSGGEIGQNSAVHKQVWQSGEIYTLERFESKSKAFARNVLGTVKEVSPIVTEALFWEASSEKSIYVEYANDVPGSGFGEPEKPFQCFHKRRRNTAFRGKNRDGCICTKCHIDSISNTHNCTKENLSRKIVPDFDLEASKASCGSLSTLLTDETSKYRHKSSNTSKEIESTAGWKLSNSPWNLQVIAHSSGSLTRFMPDDIPGVTSPMVYIAMLFSWFAWHVEDHELHSLNFLHFGSPKTWYAVPGDYAFAFEEVVRTRAYGGNIDRLATLSLLGEKTTLLSPEVVVASGIPCCRLIQNPGEFVVTFPRAYHVGFSHGFNCGEAANFGTSQWLKVAKEAAVRRAAMNYLPMLSHQQLLYLLTMSFVLRVPRSLLPGSRSSRLRDRQKEERELSVKNAFIKDILDENKLVNVLLRREPSYHAVLWNPDSLPHSIKESRSHSETGTAASAPTENVADIHADNSNQKNLLEGMSLYMDIVNDLYLDDDELPFDFQVDSGSLACVACGILGYPCMSVIQPSKSASVSFLRTDHPFSQVEGKPQYVEAPSFSCPDSLAEGDALDSPANFGKGRTSSSKIFRPRIFCLEHAVQIEELLRPKGGANVLVIYHSDYQKLKAHAAVIAEEIRCPYNFIEVSLSAPSQEDLNSISIALDGEHHDESGEEDWTAKLGINLQHWIKAGKNCSLEQMHHTLACGGAFPSPTPRSNFLIAKWQSRKLRSRSNLKRDTRPKLFEEKEILIQYSRRKPNLKAGSSLKEISEGRSGKSGSSKITTEPENKSKSAAMKVKKRKREVEVATESLNSSNGFIRSPCEGLRPRVRKNARGNGTDLSFPAEGKRVEKRMNKLPNFQYLEGLKMRAWRGPTRVLWKAA